MKLLIVLFLFGGALTQNHDSSWEIFNGHSYRLYEDPASWANAQTYCLRTGGHLLVLNSKEEETFVKNMTNGKEVWIGLSDAQQYGSWLWINSDALGYTNWCPGEPAKKQANKKCAAQSGFSNGASVRKTCWSSRFCYSRYPYICEREESDY